MKKLVLYGAFDRYNYGDNLMPILFELFIKKYYSEFLDQYKIEYASISTSNLEHYGCYKSIDIKTTIKSLPEGSAILAIGGEVLCASTSTLFLHMQKNAVEHYIFKRIRRYLSPLFNCYARLVYNAGWEFPYIPDKSKLPANIKVLYNTVGGGVKHLKPNEFKEVKQRLESCDYISVRDERTLIELRELKLNDKLALAPDSAYLMSDLIDDDFLLTKISQTLKTELPTEYIVFQAAPNKIGCEFERLCSEIRMMAQEQQRKVVLLPIGYASGHDDYILLAKINKKLPEQTILLNELNIWEIMYVIKNASVFLGTSLHGVITAMTFNVPHFGINKKIAKLDSCLKKWSVFPYNQCYSADEMSQLIKQISEESIQELTTKTLINKELVIANNTNILKEISPDFAEKIENNA